MKFMQTVEMFEVNNDSKDEDETFTHWVQTSRWQQSDVPVKKKCPQDTKVKRSRVNFLHVWVSEEWRSCRRTRRTSRNLHACPDNNIPPGAAAPTSNSEFLLLHQPIWVQTTRSLSTSTYCVNKIKRRHQWGPDSSGHHGNGPKTEFIRLRNAGEEETDQFDWSTPQTEHWSYLSIEVEIIDEFKIWILWGSVQLEEWKR